MNCLRSKICVVMVTRVDSPVKSETDEVAVILCNLFLADCLDHFTACKFIHKRVRRRRRYIFKVTRYPIVSSLVKDRKGSKPWDLYCLPRGNSCCSPAWNAVLTTAISTDLSGLCVFSAHCVGFTQYALLYTHFPFTALSITVKKNI